MAALLVLLASGAAAGTPAPGVPPTGGATTTSTTSSVPWQSQVVETAALGSIPAPSSVPPASRTPTTRATTSVAARGKARRSAKAAPIPVVAAAAPSTSPAPVVADPAQSDRTGRPQDDPETWRRLRVCESGDRYDLNTGNGFYGAYQFAAGTWRKLGYPGLPHEAAPAMQDDAARRLQATAGWSPWPACSRKLGLR